MVENCAADLPRGYVVDGTCQRRVRLRALTGSDEAYLTEISGGLLPVERTTVLLTRCVEDLGPHQVTADSIRGLTIGDREALLLQVRRLTFGELMHIVASCANPDCGERMDIQLAVGDLLVGAYSAAAQWYERSFTHDGIAYSVRFRLPTGADQEAAAARAVAARASDGLEVAAERLVRECVEAARAAGREIDVAAVPRAVVEMLGACMAELDPQAELVLSLTCPACRSESPVLLDAGEYLWRELSIQAERLEREIHTLARFYHWSEGEILALGKHRRERYLRLIAEEATA